jgi:dienelactone hydrolase
MATIVLFPSVLGARPGLHDNAELLRSRGHQVIVLDRDGETFDEYDPAMAHVESVGDSSLLAQALELTKDIPDGFFPAGFSLGGMLATYVAAHRPVRGVILFAGSVDPAALGIGWPRGVPAQLHDAVDDPWREQHGIDALKAAVEAAGGAVEAYDYPGSGHLFADASKLDEYQPAEAELMWSRVFDFLERHGG